ncbi:MAG: hypothetical protein AB7O32_01540 [Vicinamibacterales bacterium]
MTAASQTGRVTVMGPDGRPRVYTVDPLGHRIVVTDAETGDVLFTFGRRGSPLGCFDVPLDLAVVAPTFHDDPPSAAGESWLAVADYGNARVQIFELDGRLVDVLNGEDLDYGWRPCEVTWRAPFLQIRGVEGRGCRIHLAAALLAHAGGRVDRLTPASDDADVHQGCH